METLNSIINFLTIVAGLCCAFLITRAIFNIIHDQDEEHIYRKKLKNGIIAFVLILSIIPVKELITTKYFNENELNIGTVPDSITLNPINDIVANDRDGRDTFKYNNTVYVITSKDCVLYLKNNGANKTPKFYLWKVQKFSDCQGMTRGLLNTVKQFIILKDGKYYFLDCSSLYSNIISSGTGVVMKDEIFEMLTSNLPEKEITNINYGSWNYSYSDVTLVN